MRLLLVEDEPRVARFIAKGAREQGYAVDIAADGEEALYKAGITDYEAFARDILDCIKDRPISLEVFADEFPEMECQARTIAQ